MLLVKQITAKMCNCFFSVAKVNGEKPESNRRNRKKNIKICTLKRMQKATEQSSDEDLRRIFHTICTSSSIGGSIVSRSHASARIIFYSYLDHLVLVLQRSFINICIKCTLCLYLDRAISFGVVCISTCINIYSLQTVAVALFSLLVWSCCVYASFDAHKILPAQMQTIVCVHMCSVREHHIFF